MELLTNLGFDAADAAGLIARWPDGARRARTMAANVELLRAAGYRFEPWPPRGLIVQGMRGGWAVLGAAEAAGRVAAQRARHAANAAARPAGGGGDFNVRPAAEVRAEAEANRRNRELEATIDQLADEQWQALAEQLKPRWAETWPGRPFPVGSRKNMAVRALAKAYLGGPAVGSEAAR